MRVMLSVMCDLSPGKRLPCWGRGTFRKKNSTKDDCRQFIKFTGCIRFSPSKEKSIFP